MLHLDQVLGLILILDFLCIAHVLSFSSFSSYYFFSEVCMKVNFLQAYTKAGAINTDLRKTSKNIVTFSLQKDTKISTNKDIWI